MSSLALLTRDVLDIVPQAIKMISHHPSYDNLYKFTFVSIQPYLLSSLVRVGGKLPRLGAVVASEDRERVLEARGFAEEPREVHVVFDDASSRVLVSRIAVHVRDKRPVG